MNDIINTANMNFLSYSLHINHNDLTKYFIDYNEFYPTGLSFELAIQVFWRPKQLTKGKKSLITYLNYFIYIDNWNNRYSKYLDDERVYGSCGIHPHWSSHWKETCIEDIERCLEHPKIVAIGEIGLDRGPK
jgi:predicted metal-dependent TIM-barrel fold hydrolase